MVDAAHFVKKGVELLLYDNILLTEESEHLRARFGSFDNAIKEIVAHSDFMDARIDQLEVPLSLSRPMFASIFGYKCIKSVAQTGSFDVESVVQDIIRDAEAKERAYKADHKILMPAFL